MDPDTNMTHILLDAEWEEERTIDILQDEKATTAILDALCEKHQFTVLQRVFHFFEPQGMTCLYLLSESHLSIHTWPERQFCSIDLFCCRELGEEKIRDIVSMLRDKLHLGRIKCHAHPRSFFTDDIDSDY